MRNDSRLSPLRFLCLMALAIAGSLPAQPAAAQAPSGGAHSTPAPVANAVRLTAPVVIDGRLDEEVW
ncbi:MAG: hypothetical protein H0U13_08740, partial [Gemmatimonadaceae bacterium]|nr:hypothetical protein [Gemmatimonadaceae bacterium]